MTIPTTPATPRPIRIGPSRRIALVVAAAVLVPVGVAACSGDDDGAFATLPPIRTTTTTSTTTTTVSTERVFHVIQSGESLSIIAAQYGVPLIALIELNEIENPDNVPAGATIEIPRNVVIANAPGAQGSDTDTDDTDDTDDGDTDDGDTSDTSDGDASGDGG